MPPYSKENAHNRHDLQEIILEEGQYSTPTGPDLRDASTISVPNILAPIFNEDNPLSVGSLLPMGLKNRLKLLAHDNEAYFTKDETALYSMLEKNGAAPSTLDNRIRLAFWHEYDAACAGGRHMNVSNICAGLISTTYFLQKYIVHAEKAAWVLLPPVKYDVMVTESLQHGLTKMREMLDLPIHSINLKGQEVINTKVLEAKIKIVAMLDMRMKGAFVERKVNVNIQKNITDEISKINMEELEGQLLALERATAPAPSTQQ